MKKNFEIEMLDNGIVIKEENYAEAVLYNEDANVEEDSESESDSDAKYADCQKRIGALFTDMMLGDFSELSKESREKYDKTGKPTFGYRVEMKITPLAKGEFKL